MIDENEFIGEEEPINDDTTEREKEENAQSYNFLSAKEIVGLEGIAIGKITKLDQAELDKFMTTWYPESVKMVESMHLDDALSRVIKIENPYVAIVLGFGLIGLTGIMAAKGIKAESAKESEKKEEAETDRKFSDIIRQG